MGHGYRIVRNRLGIGRHLLALIRRPILLWEAARVSVAFRTHRGLFPSSEYLDWRFHTAYGDDMSAVVVEDTIAFLGWRRRMRRVA